MKNNRSLCPSLIKKQNLIGNKKINFSNERESNYDKNKSKNISAQKFFNEKLKKNDIFNESEVMSAYTKKKNIDYINNAGVSLKKIKIDVDKSIFNKNYEWVNLFRQCKTENSSMNTTSVLIKKNTPAKLNIYK